jgi:hypothetical protein
VYEAALRHTGNDVGSRLIQLLRVSFKRQVGVVLAIQFHTTSGKKT